MAHSKNASTWKVLKIDMDSQVAAKAVIRNGKGKFLIVREDLKWQIVGGRLEKGEVLKEGLTREAMEETGISDLKIGEVVHVDEWFAKPEGVHKHIVAIFFLCTTQTEKVVLSEEHQEYAWVLPEDLDKYGDFLHPDTKKAILLAARSNN